VATNPVIEALLRRSQRGVGKINARGSAIGSALQPFAGRAQGYYSQVQGQEQALGGALNQSLANQGQSLGGDIGSALGGIQAPSQAVSQYAGGTATTGTQAGAAVGALSSADLERLQVQGSAEQVYASALPRLAALAADQERRGFLEQMGQELTDKMADLEQQRVAQQYDEIWRQREWQYRARQDRLDRKSENRKWRYGVKQDNKASALANQAMKLAAQQTAYDMGQDYISNTQAQQRIDLSAGNLALATRRQGESERQFQVREARLQRQLQIALDAATKAGGKPNASLSAKYGYIVDSYGKPILDKRGRRRPVVSDTSSVPDILKP
jgi:hypothetical protein